MISSGTSLARLAYRGFKALKQIVKLHFKLQEREHMLTAYRSASAIHWKQHRETVQ